MSTPYRKHEVTDDELREKQERDLERAHAKLNAHGVSDAEIFKLVPVLGPPGRTRRQRKDALKSEIRTIRELVKTERIRHRELHRHLHVPQCTLARLDQCRAEILRHHARFLMRLTWERSSLIRQREHREAWIDQGAPANLVTMATRFRDAGLTYAEIALVSYAVQGRQLPMKLVADRVATLKSSLSRAKKAAWPRPPPSGKEPSDAQESNSSSKRPSTG